MAQKIWGERPFIGQSRLRHRRAISSCAYEYTNSGKCQFERSKKSRPFLRIFLILDIFLTKKRTLPPWKRFLKNSKKRHTYGISGDLWPLKLAFARVCVFIVVLVPGFPLMLSGLMKGQNRTMSQKIMHFLSRSDPYSTNVSAFLESYLCPRFLSIVRVCPFIGRMKTFYKWRRRNTSRKWVSNEGTIMNAHSPQISLLCRILPTLFWLRPGFLWISIFLVGGAP